MTPITSSQLLKILMDIKGVCFATITYETDPKMVQKNRVTKEPNPFLDQVIKRTTVNVTLGHNYANSVNNQLEREGKEKDFVAQPRKWGERISGTTLVEYKGMMYVEAKINHKPKENQYLNINTRQPISRTILENYLPVKSAPKSQGTDKEIILRDIKLPSIKEIIINGGHYVIQ